MPRILITDEIFDEIVKTIKEEKFTNTKQIAEYISNKFNVPIKRRSISDINIGAVHRKDYLKYPISLVYTNRYEEDHFCCICGEKAFAMLKRDKNFYCKKHFSQAYRNKIMDKTIYDRNDFIFHEDYAEIILRDKDQNITGITKIDLDQVEKVKKYKWYKMFNNKYYCQGTLENGVKVRLHRFLMGVTKTEDFVDHINGDSLDNRLSNLRIVDRTENMHNLKLKNPLRGITTRTTKNGKYYVASITCNKKRYFLGTYENSDDALAARLAAEKKFGFLR